MAGTQAVEKQKKENLPDEAAGAAAYMAAVHDERPADADGKRGFFGRAAKDPSDPSTRARPLCN